MDIGVATEMLKLFFYMETTNTHFFVLKFKPVKHRNKHVLYTYILNSITNLLIFIQRGTNNLFYIL